MSNDQDILHRLSQLEMQEERASDIANKLERAVDKLAIHLSHYKEHHVLDRIRLLEIEMANQKLIGSAIKWLGVSIASTAIILSISYLFGAKDF
jgi:hypothetical protein